MKKRAMKKWIPEGIYCYGCKWRKFIRYDYLSKEEYKDNITKTIENDNKKYNKNYIIPKEIKICEHTDTCEEQCWTDGSNCCKCSVYRCEYLEYTDYEEDSLLWDGVKECDVHLIDKYERKYLN